LLHDILHVTQDEQRKLLALISAERAADIVEELPESHAANLMELMPAAEVAPIVGEMASDDRVDVLGELPGAETAAILEQLDEEDATELRRLSSYAPDTAGGPMMTEFASYPMAATIRDVLSDLTGREGEYEFLTVHYVYVVVKRHRLKDVIRIRDLVFTDWDRPIGAVAAPALTVRPEASLAELTDFFDENDFAAVPVVDERNNLPGIVRRRSVPGLAAWLWKGNLVLSLAVAVAPGINTVVAVSIGGVVPLVQKRLGIDPAVGSGPLLTTITDLCGFFLVLSLASLALPRLA
jgi:magnesium transporter